MAVIDTELPGCGFMHAHTELVERVRRKLPSDITLEEVAELFKVFGDMTRIRILYVLNESEMCVCDIAALIGVTQSAASHQLKVLKQAKLIRYEKRGKAVFYYLADDHVKSILNLGMEHAEE